MPHRSSLERLEQTPLELKDIQDEHLQLGKSRTALIEPMRLEVNNTTHTTQ